MSSFDEWFKQYYESYTFRPSETEIRPVYNAAYNAGMERAAKIVETHESSGRSVWDIPNISIRMVTKAIRKEIT